MSTRNALDAWCERFEVTSILLAGMLDVHEETVARYRRGDTRPDDEMKVKIEVATRALEANRGRKRLRGVRIADWFPASSAAA